MHVCLLGNLESVGNLESAFTSQLVLVRGSMRSAHVCHKDLLFGSRYKRNSRTFILSGGEEMERLNPAVVALVLLTVSVSAVPTAAHRPPKDLSDEPHYVGDDQAHNSDYDHEAFLGKEEAKTFDQLSPAEAKKRLGIIVKKIDKNGDGNVDEDELVDWVRRVARR